MPQPDSAVAMELTGDRLNRGTTSKMKERHWSSLIAALQRNDCVLVLGPEIPIDDITQLRSGEAVRTVATEVIEGLAAELESEGRTNVVRESLSATAQALADDSDFGEAQLPSTASQLYASFQGVDRGIHDSIAKLPAPLILTTCHDDLLERSLRNSGKSVQRQRYAARERGYNPEFTVSRDPQAPTLYHLFGTFHEPKTLVLSEDDIFDWVLGLAANTNSLPKSLLSVLRQPMLFFLFIGFGIQHQHLRILVKILLRHFEFNRKKNACAAESLQALAGNERGGTIDFYRRGMRVEVVDQDIAGFLAELHQRLSSAGPPPVQLSFLGCRPKVFISYASEDRDMAQRLFDHLDKTGFEPWFDKTRLTAGDQWDGRIRESINHCDFALVIVTTTLAGKRDSFVNKEIALALDRGINVRGGCCVIPLVTPSMQACFALEFPDLSGLQAEILTLEIGEAGFNRIASVMTREYQRRQRGRFK